MSAGAWVMLAVTWTVIAAFTIHFFRRILRPPSSRDRS